MAALAFSVYSDGQLSGLEAYEDPGLVDFYKNNLQNVCPYYVPDGSTYRDCILDLIKKEQKRLKIGNEEPGEVNAYCSEGAKKTADDYTLGYVDTYNTCRLYKLQEMK